MRVNVPVAYPPVLTHEGAPAARIDGEAQLRRLVMTHTLWEDSFYVDGKTAADQLREAIANVDADTVANIAVEARERQKLRHVPLFLVRELARRKPVPVNVAATLERVIQRPDELAEFLAIYWKDGKQPLAAQVKKGLARAFRKFDEYALAKWNKDGAVKLRDVLFLSHARPKDDAQADVFKRLAAKSLETPDTWEVALSASKGERKREEWERLLSEKKLGALALLRNLRNMTAASVPETAIRSALAEMKTDRVLPFRFIAAANAAPSLEDALEPVMFKCLEGAAKLMGRTLLLVDVSGSMGDPISGKSDLRRIDAATGLAMLIRETGEQVAVFTFSNSLVQVPARRGFALRDAIVRSQPMSSTHLGMALQLLDKGEYERLIVITDEQSHDRVPAPKGRGYMLNVAANKNGVGYGSWLHIDGWSEAVIDFIRQHEER
jgi:60 kDa SS-A/Ro ribonucleoprotein